MDVKFGNSSRSLVYSNVVILTESDSDSECVEDDFEDTAFPKRHETSITLAIQTAASHEDDLYGYLKHVNIICRNSSFVLVFRALFTVVALFIFIVGAMRFHDCPYEEELPLFLVFEGLAIILKSGIGIVSTCFRRTKEENERHCLDTCNDILSLFLVLWTLTGTVWTIGVFVQAETTDRTGPKYCDSFVVYCSLSFIIFLYSCVILFVSIIIVLTSYFYSKAGDHGKDLPYNVHVDKL